MVDSGVEIIVVSPSGHRSLAVAVNARGGVDDAIGPLRDYMHGVGCEAGLVFTRDAIAILHETYRQDPSIQVAGQFPLRLAEGIHLGDDEVAFVDQIQDWVEALRDDKPVAAEPLRAALDKFVMPSLIDGDVSAARPRERRAAG